MSRFPVHFPRGSIVWNDRRHGDPEDPERHDVVVFGCGAGARADADQGDSLIGMSLEEGSSSVTLR